MQHETRVREGQPLDLQSYLALLDRLSRLATTIGLERRAKRLPSLQEYLHSTESKP
jgi:hypothetical protein